MSNNSRRFIPVIVLFLTFRAGLLAGAGAAQPAPAAAAVQSLLKAGTVREAVDRFDAEVARGVPADPVLLAQLARAVLNEVTSTPDVAARVEACLTLLSGGPHACSERLNADAERSLVTRLRLSGQRLASGSAGADRALGDLTATVTDRDWVAVIDAAPDFPPSLAVRLLTRALAVEAEDVRYGALDALSRIEDASALPVLRIWATREGTPGRFLALAAVARSGDRQAITALKAVLSDLHGQDLLAAGVALAQTGDADGMEAINQVLRGPEELLHLEAAAALDALGRPEGRRLLESELGNANVWIRLRALEKLRGHDTTPRPAVWRLMSDPMPWVRVRAAQVTLEATRQLASPAPR